jgi:hypothetical protein
MQLKPNEIDSIEDAGVLNQQPVKMIRTKGGYWIAVGRPKGKLQQEALAAGSHPAIVRYNLEKQYPDFQPSMMKSAHYAENTHVDKHSHFLTEELLKSGHDIYSITNGTDIEFQITKQDTKLHSVYGNLIDDSLVLKNMEMDSKFTRGLAGAATEKALSCGAKKIRVEGK